MKRVSSLIVTAIFGGVLLSLGATTSHAQGSASAVFSLALNPNSADVNNLKAGNVVLIDAFIATNGTSGIAQYQEALAFDPSLFSVTTTAYTPTGLFAQAQPVGRTTLSGSTGTADAPYTGIVAGGEANNGTDTTIIPTTATKVGTFSLTALKAPTVDSQILFSNLLPAVPPSALQSRYKVDSTGNPNQTPSFQNGVIQIRVAAVPETGTLLGLGSLLGIGGLALRRKRIAC